MRATADHDLDFDFSYVTWRKQNVATSVWNSPVRMRHAPYSTADQPDAAFANASAVTAEQDLVTLVAEWI